MPVGCIKARKIYVKKILTDEVKKKNTSHFTLIGFRVEAGMLRRMGIWTQLIMCYICIEDKNSIRYFSNSKILLLEKYLSTILNYCLSGTFLLEICAFNYVVQNTGEYHHSFRAVHIIQSFLSYQKILLLLLLSKLLLQI